MRISDWSSDVCSSDLLRPRVMHWKRLMQIWDGTREIAYLWNSRSKRVALKVPSWSITDEEGRIVPMCQLVRPTGGTRMQEIAMWASLWKEIDRDEFQKLWETEAVEAEAKVDIETVNLATGQIGRASGRERGGQDR